MLFNAAPFHQPTIACFNNKTHVSKICIPAYLTNKKKKKQKKHVLMFTNQNRHDQKKNLPDNTNVMSAKHQH